MSTSFPAALDAFTNPTSSNTLANSTPSHSQQHANLNDAVSALEAKVGVTGSGVTTSHDYRISQLEDDVDDLDERLDDVEAVTDLVAISFTTKTSSYTATTSDSVILCNAAGGAITITLPPASTCLGKEFRIKKIDSSGNLVRVKGHDTELIDNLNIRVLPVQNNFFRLVCSGLEWFIL